MADEEQDAVAVEETEKRADLFEIFGTNKKAELKGVWVEFLPGVSFLIARDGTPTYKKAIRDRYRPYEMFLRERTGLPPSVEPKVVTAVILDALLLDWKGVIYKGAEVPFSRETAQPILEELTDLRDWIQEQAGNRQNFKREFDQQVGKPSGG